MLQDGPFRHPPMKIFGDIFEELYRLRGKSYEVHKQGLPADVREGITRLCEIFEGSSEEERRDIVANVVRGVSFLFLRFSTDMSITAVRETDSRAVFCGLEALAIEDCRGDWRDSTIVLAMLCHSARKIGVDADEALRFARRLSVSETGDKLFGSFLQRTPEKRELSKFWIKEGATPTGEFTYRAANEPDP